MYTTDAHIGRGVEEVLERVATLEPLIRAASDEAETECRMPDRVAAALAEAGCFHLYRPRSLGGLELDPVSGLRVIEELSRIDGAVGWNVALPNSQEPFGAWLSAETAEAIFGDPETILAGSFFPPRRAVPVDGGYRLSGRCTFNSGCHTATWIMGLAHVYDGDEPRLDENGQPATLLTFFPKGDARILDNWDTLGMRGTGSHDVECENLFVPAERAIPFAPLERPGAPYEGPFHRLTIWPSVATNAVPSLGIARAAIDDFQELAREKTPSYTTTTLKDRPMVQSRFARAVAKVESARTWLFAAFEEAWQGALAGRGLTLEDRARLQLAISNAPVAAAEAVDLIHSLVGTSGIRNDKPFQRYFRDVHVLTQHAYVSESRFTAVGQVAFGLEPDWGFLYF